VNHRKISKTLIVVFLVEVVFILLAIGLLNKRKLIRIYENFRGQGKPVVLLNQSSRMEISFKDENSASKVGEAILLVWAKKLNLSLNELKSKLEKEKIKLPIRFLELDENCQQKEQVTEAMVDLSKPLKLMVWDQPCGFGPGNATRIQFKVENEQLQIMAYWLDNPPKTAITSSLIRGLEILFNDGEVNYSDLLIPEVKPFLIEKLADGSYEPEVITLTK